MIVPLSPLPHAGQDELDQPGGAEQVHVELAAGLVQRHVLDGSVGAVAGVVDQDVDAAGLGEDLLDAQRGRFLVGDVHGERSDAALAQVGHPVGAAGHAVDDETGVLETECGRFSDPGRGSGHEGDFLGGCGASW